MPAATPELARDLAARSINERKVPLTRPQRRWVQRHQVGTRGPAKTMPPSTSQCACGQGFAGRTTREAIAKRRDHERETGHGSKRAQRAALAGR